MNIETNKQLIRDFFEAFSRGDFGSAFAHVSDSASWWVPGTLPFSGTKTKEQYLQVVNAIARGFPGGLRLTVTGLTAEGDKVAAEVESLGAHVNGKTYNNRYHFLFTVRDGTVQEVKEYMDTLHLHQLITPN